MKRSIISMRCACRVYGFTSRAAPAPVLPGMHEHHQLLSDHSLRKYSVGRAVSPCMSLCHAYMRHMPRLGSTAQAERLDAASVRADLGQLFPDASHWMSACPDSGSRLHCFLRSLRFECQSVTLQRLGLLIPGGLTTVPFLPDHVCTHQVGMATAAQSACHCLVPTDIPVCAWSCVELRAGLSARIATGLPVAHAQSRRIPGERPRHGAVPQRSNSMLTGSVCMDASASTCSSCGLFCRCTGSGW